MSGPGVADVLEARRRLRGGVLETPLERSAWLSDALGAEVLLKLECRQRTGSFKIRGALNALAQLSRGERARGVVTASAGNHGLGVAFAARETGARATVFVPRGAPATKRSRISRLGAELREVAGSYDDAHAAAAEHARRSGALYLHAYSDPRVVAGQGTVGLEIFVERPDVGTVLVPVGGGGLVGGIGRTARAVRPGARVVGVQSAATPAMHDSLAAGELRSPAAVPTLCDGLAGDTDRRSLELAREVVDRVLLVEEPQIRRAVALLYREEGVVAEGSGAVGVAALLAGLLPVPSAPVAVVISGGNIDASLLAAILSEECGDGDDSPLPGQASGDPPDGVGGADGGADRPGGGRGAGEHLVRGGAARR